MNLAHARIASVIVAALCAVPAAAQPVPAEPIALELTAWPTLPRRAATAVLDYRLWMGRGGRASFGVGLNAPLFVDLDAMRSGSTAMVVGMRYRLSEQSRFTLDSGATALDGLPAERDLRMGFEFKPTVHPALGLARGSLLRVQWTSRSQLSLRVRGGGLTFAYRSQFY